MVMPVKCSSTKLGEKVVGHHFSLITVELIGMNVSYEVHDTKIKMLEFHRGSKTIARPTGKIEPAEP